MLFRKSIFVIAILCFCSQVNAQKETLSSEENNSFKLPPIFELIDSAIRHNAMVRARELDINSQKNNWTRNLGLQIDSRYGTFDNFSSNISGPSTTISSSTTSQLNYGAGFYVKFPLFDMLDRKNQIKKTKIQLEQAKSFSDAQKDEVKQLVIRLYQDLLLKQRILVIKSEGLGNAKVNMDMIEKEFRNGTITVSEYVRISEIVERAKTDYESAKTDFITGKMILEDLVGFTINNADSNK